MRSRTAVFWLNNSIYLQLGCFFSQLSISFENYCKGIENLWYFFFFVVLLLFFVVFCCEFWVFVMLVLYFVYFVIGKMRVCLFEWRSALGMRRVALASA